MNVKPSDGNVNRTEKFISAARLPKTQSSLILNPDYLDDETLMDEERIKVLAEIFSRDVRNNELQALASQLAPLLDDKPAHHALICGPTGCGKTATTLHFLSSLQGLANKEEIPLQWRFIELSAQSTCFSALNRIAVSLAASRYYFKGIPTELMQNRIQESLQGFKGSLILFLDEIDNVETDRNIFMTYLIKTLPRQVPVKLVYIFTTNRLDWDKTLDARVLSCMRKNDLIFNPYHAFEITEILNLRVLKALDQSKINEAAISLIAAISSKNSGDARKAVELLTKSAQIAERKGKSLTIHEVEQAEKELEVEKTISLAQSLPLHQILCLLACYTLLVRRKQRIHSGDVYDQYKSLTIQIKHRPISQRRFSDIINALDLYSLINARLVSHGRYGKTREIESTIGKELILELIDCLQKRIQCEW